MTTDVRYARRRLPVADLREVHARLRQQATARSTPSPALHRRRIRATTSPHTSTCRNRPFLREAHFVREHQLRIHQRPTRPDLQRRDVTAGLFGGRPAGTARFTSSRRARAPLEHTARAHWLALSTANPGRPDFCTMDCRSFLAQTLAPSAATLGRRSRSSRSPIGYCAMCRCTGRDDAAEHRCPPRPLPDPDGPRSCRAPEHSVRAAPLRAGPAPALHQISRLRDPNVDQTPDISDYVNAGENRRFRVDRPPASGRVQAPSALFTARHRPPLVRLPCPRTSAAAATSHHQATATAAQRSILMFSPYHQLFDSPRASDAMPKTAWCRRSFSARLPIRLITIPARRNRGDPELSPLSDFPARFALQLASWPARSCGSTRAAARAGCCSASSSSSRGCTSLTRSSRSGRRCWARGHVGGSFTAASSPCSARRSAAHSASIAACRCFSSLRRCSSPVLRLRALASRRRLRHCLLLRAAAAAQPGWLRMIVPGSRRHPRYGL